MALVVVAVAVLWGVHHGTGSNHPTTSVTTNHAATTSPSTSPTTTTTTTVASELPAAAQTQYDQYVAAFDTAASKTRAGIDALGSSPTLAQAAPILATWLTAVQLYNLQVHYVPWPAPMWADAQADDSQLAAYLTFLQSSGTADPNNAGAWLTQLKQQTQLMQTADNKVRQDSALPAAPATP